MLVLGDRAAQPLADRDVLVYHAGGPGISSIGQMLGNPPNVDFSRFTVLAWDGFTSRGEASTCGEITTSFLTERTEDSFAELAPQVTKECEGGWDSPLELGAWAAAEELDDIRHRLGIAKLSLFALSYGTAIAEAYVYMHPESVRLAVLDAPIGLEVPWGDRVRVTNDVMAGLANKLAASCVSEACSAALDGSALDGAYKKLRDAVLSVEPFVGSGDVILAPVMFDQAAEVAVRTTESWSAWATAVDQALRSDGSALWRLGYQGIEGVDWANFYWSLCSTIDRPGDPHVYRGARSPLSFSRTSLLAPCAQFPRGVERPAATGGPPPVLVIASAHDPLAPAGLLEFSPRLRAFGPGCVTQANGHTSLGSGNPAIAGMIYDFINTADAVGAATRCAGLQKD